MEKIPITKDGKLKVEDELKDKFWISDNPNWSKDEDSIVSHVNNDHKDVIIATLKGIYNIYDKNVEVLSLSIDGYYLKTNNEIVYIPFYYPCENSKQVRDEISKVEYSGIKWNKLKI